jgi:ABC-type nickel/cobalt efflux system permease component RcnA
MTNLVTLATACVLGFTHALEIDHMLAVTAFVSRRPTLATAVRFGFRWGLGHSIAVLIAGTLLLATGFRWSERYDRLGEAVVGTMLIGIGAWALRSTRNLHIHPPDEHGDHLHVHTHGHGGDLHQHPHQHHHHPEPVPPSAHAHGASRSIGLVGLLHGLAGTTAVVALVPITMLDRTMVGIGYLLAFGFGVTVAMTVFAAASAMAMRQAAARSLRLGRRVSSWVGGAGILTGAVWIWRALVG